ncbi:hypothetical protein [Gemmatimonas sp.]|uniref:hypothetical protein n=1 Tax=Gemmatimonas sp. TaxID=1962908 RepID=UPI00286DF377|nr:hypothetical protein [Gemmatimonas sp.]
MFASLAVLAIAAPAVVPAQAPPTRAWVLTQVAADLAKPGSYENMPKLGALFGRCKPVVAAEKPQWRDDYIARLYAVMYREGFLADKDTVIDGKPSCVLTYTAKAKALPRFHPPPYAANECGPLVDRTPSGEVNWLYVCVERPVMGEVTGIRRIDAQHYLATFTWRALMGPWAEPLGWKWDEQKTGAVEITLWDTGWRVGRVRYQ